MTLGFDLIYITLILTLIVGFVRLSLKLEIRFSHIMLLIAFSLILVPSAEAIGGDKAKAEVLAGLWILYTMILIALSDQSDKLREERDAALADLELVAEEIDRLIGIDDSTSEK